MPDNRTAFLDMIARSEGTYGVGDNGYNVLVGSTPARPSLFESYDDHPRKLIALPKLGINSTAAGRYQILARYYEVYKNQLDLPDFGPESQDKIALQMIRECKALNDIDAGRLTESIMKCASRWASLPGSSYGQHTNTFGALRQAYLEAGGVISSV